MSLVREKREKATRALTDALTTAQMLNDLTSPLANRKLLFPHCPMHTKAQLLMAVCGLSWPMSLIADAQSREVSAGVLEGEREHRSKLEGHEAEGREEQREQAPSRRQLQRSLLSAGTCSPGYAKAGHSRL